VAEADWREELDGWLEPFLAALGHRKRRVWAPVYVRGLLGPGERKSLRPMATGLGLRGHDRLQLSSPARPGTTRPCGGSRSRGRTRSSAARTRCW